MPLKDNFFYYFFLRVGVTPHRKHQGGQEAGDRNKEKAVARAFTGVSKEAKWGRVNLLALALSLIHI